MTHPYLHTDVIFHPNWWHKNYGLTFDRGFFYDPKRRVNQEKQMRELLYERFGDLGLGRQNAPRRPFIGPVILGSGYFVQEILGCEIRYNEDSNPWVISPKLTEAQTWKLKTPENVEDTPPMKALYALMQSLEDEFGYLQGDVPMHSVVNMAFDLRGQDYFLDLIENPDLVEHFHAVIARTIYEVGRRIKARTGTISLSVCRLTAGFMPDLFTIPNCTLQMISPEHYRQYLKKHDTWLGEKIPPMGIHHCGNNAHRYAKDYADTGAIYMDVGCGSDIKICREAFKDRWLSLRMDPVKLMHYTAAEAAEATEALLEEHGAPFDRLAVKCDNIDYGTPDEAIRAMFETVARYRGDRENPIPRAYEVA